MQKVEMATFVASHRKKDITLGIWFHTCLISENLHVTVILEPQVFKFWHKLHVVPETSTIKYQYPCHTTDCETINTQKSINPGECMVLLNMLLILLLYQDQQNLCCTAGRMSLMVKTASYNYAT